MRVFETGATRDEDVSKNDYEGYLSPEVLETFGDYMTRHRIQKDGSVRASDNWQKGIPIDVYIKSLVRHAFDLWLLHRGVRPGRLILEMGSEATIGEMKEEAACALFFNVQGYMFESLKAGWIWGNGINE